MVRVKVKELNKNRPQLFLRRYPGEWEKQSATWLAWPHNKKEWGEKLPQIKEFYIELINLILQFQDVKLILASEDMLNEVNACFINAKNPKSATQNPKLHLIVIPNNDVWIRDYGPFFLHVIARNEVTKQSSNVKRNEIASVASLPRNDKLIADFEFNGWGEKFPPYDLDNQVPKNIALYLGEVCESYPFVLEGGAIDLNGDGVAITTEECLLHKKRNKELSKEKIESYLKDIFNLKEIIWLKQGLESDHTDGHIDNVCRFIGKNKVLINAPENKRLKEIKNSFKNKFELIEIPFPDVDREQIPTATYLNFIFVNGGLIVPTFNSKNDDIAIHALQKIFPKRKVVGIDSTLLLEEGGGLHCISKQEISI